MSCPLCGGPLQREPLERFLRRYELLSGDGRQAVGDRLTVALWMAIDALESQAQALRVVAVGAGEVPTQARQAEADARILREVARTHAHLGHDADPGHRTA